MAAIRADAKHLLGVMPENLGLFDDLTIEEHLLLTCDIYGAPRGASASFCGCSVSRKGENTPHANARMACARRLPSPWLLLPNPRVLLLDEPFEAVDPVSARLMFDVTARCREARRRDPADLAHALDRRAPRRPRGAPSRWQAGSLRPAGRRGSQNKSISNS